MARRQPSANAAPATPAASLLTCLMGGSRLAMARRAHHGPSGLTTAQAVHRLKLGTNPCDSLNYRLLLIMSTLYRKWGAMSLRHLHSWTRSWRLQEIFAGVPGAGTEDAWMSLTIQFRAMPLQGLPFCGGAADILEILP